MHLYIIYTHCTALYCTVLYCTVYIQYCSKNREEAAKDASALRLRPEDEVRIASAIIELFHLLPPHPEHRFLEPLINYVVKLDELLPTLPYQGNWNHGLNQQLQLAAEKDQTR